MKDLDAIRAGLILLTTALGSGGAFGLWKLFTGDFLNPYRQDQADLRERAKAAEERADLAEQVADGALSAARQCAETNARLRLQLIEHGVTPIEEPQP